MVFDSAELTGAIMRKTATWTVEAEGRDKGKTFILTEMSATDAEDWAIRVLLALGKANVELPEGALQLGMAALAEIGLKKLFALNPNTVRPLLSELMGCVQLQPDKKRPEVKRALIESDTEEVKTLLMLKWEVLKLHLDFSLAGSLSESLGSVLAAIKPKPTMQTSPASSESLSEGV